jgi:hypothetical protein
MRSVVEAGGTRNSERKRNPLLRSYVVFHGRQIRLPVRLMMSGAAFSCWPIWRARVCFLSKRGTNTFAE